MPAPVWAIVLNWNGLSWTSRCLTSLSRLQYPAVKILVLDNGSTDGSVSALRAAFPAIEILELGKNLGFAAGNNVGIRRARNAGASYIWLVNNDAETAPGALGAMVAVAERDPTIGAVGSVLVAPEEGGVARVWGGGRVNRWSGRAAHLRASSGNDAVHYLVGASLLLRTRAIDQADGLDEGFFLYWEDTDLCFRLRAAGWRLAVAEQALVFHRAHGSLDGADPRFDFHYHVSAARFFRRHAPVPLIPILVSTLARTAIHASRAEWRRARSVLRGTWVGLRLRAGDVATSCPPA